MLKSGFFMIFLTDKIGAAAAFLFGRVQAAIFGLVNRF